MKITFLNTIVLEKFPQKRKITRLLMLTTIAVLFLTSTTACTSSNIGKANSQLQTSRNASILSNSSPNPLVTSPTIPLRSIHMLDKTYGWALTDSSTLKTVDGGLHWQDVSPTNENLNFSGASPIIGDFLNDQDAWIVPPGPNLPGPNLLHTTDGGKSWQSSTIHPLYPTSALVPYFLDTSDGWVQALSQPGSGNPAIIFNTSDSGQNWKQLKDIGGPLSFTNKQNGWSGVFSTQSTQPTLEITNDGGQTWHSLALPALPGGSKADTVETMPPVFVGNNGQLLVEIQGATSSRSTGLDLYVTQNGGQTWTPTKFANINRQDGQALIVDTTVSQHAWAASGTNLYATNDGGQSWTQLPQLPDPVDTFNFVDPNNGWAISTRIQAPHSDLLHTTDGGRTWQPINYSIIGKSIATSSVANGPKKQCGTLSYQQTTANTEILSDKNAQQSANCFLQAFEQCAPASIDLNVIVGPTPSPSSGSSQESIHSDIKSQLVVNSPTTSTFSTKLESGGCTLAGSVSTDKGTQTQQTCLRVEQFETTLYFVDCSDSGTMGFPLVATKSTQKAS